MEVTFVVLAAEGLEGALAVNGLVHRRAGEADERGVRQAGHEEVAEVAARGAVRFVDEDVDVPPRVQVRRHVAELVDHRHDDPAVVVPKKLIETGDAARVLQIAQAERGEVLEHLVFQLVAVDHQQHRRLVRLGSPEKHLRRLDHREGLAAALRVPDEAARAPGIERAADGRVHRAGLVLAQDVFVQLLVLLGEDDVILEEGEHLRNGAETLHLGLQAAGNVKGGRVFQPALA